MERKFSNKVIEEVLMHFSTMRDTQGRHVLMDPDVLIEAAQVSKEMLTRSTKA